MGAKQALKLIYAKCGSWRRVADSIGGGHSPNTWRRAAAGEAKLSPDADAALRAVCGLAPRNANGRIERMRTEVLAEWVRGRREVIL